MLIVKGVDPSEIKVGDVIVFKLINHTDGVDIPIVHRVVRVYQNTTTGDYWFSTKGDNPDTNAAFVDWPTVQELNIHEDRVIGKIIGRIPYIGGIYKYFQESQGRIALLIVVGVLFLATIIFSFTGKDDEEKKEKKEVFSDSDETIETEKVSVKKSEDTAFDHGTGFWDGIKKVYNKAKAKKHFIIPGIMLGVIILVPIIDTLDANWGSQFGVVSVEFDKSRQYTVQGGDDWFIYSFVTLNNPGHWHQKVNSVTIQVINSTTGEVLGENQWYLVYNFEGEKRLSLGAWVEDGLLIEGLQYQLKITAHLGTKFGANWDDTVLENFVFDDPST
ncbi:MAG: signal peptidase I [Candidatus Thorarchaeota archaeon]